MQLEQGVVCCLLLCLFWFVFDIYSGQGGKFYNLNSSTSVVTCNGRSSCGNTNFTSIARLICYGVESCAGSSVYTTTTTTTSGTGFKVVCHGYASCFGADFFGVKELWLTGYSSANFGYFSSIGDKNNPSTMIVIIIGQNIASGATFRCLESDTCIFYLDPSSNSFISSERNYNCSESATCIYRTFESDEWFDEIDNFINDVSDDNINVTLIRPRYESFNTSNASSNSNGSMSGLEWWGILVIVVAVVVLLVIAGIFGKYRTRKSKKANGGDYQLMKE